MVLVIRLSNIKQCGGHARNLQGIDAVVDYCCVDQQQLT